MDEAGGNSMNILYATNFEEVIKEDAYKYFGDEISGESTMYIVDLLQNPTQVPEEYIGFQKPAALILAEANEKTNSTKEIKHLGDASLLNNSLFGKSLTDQVFGDYYRKIGEIAYGKLSSEMRGSIFENIYGELYTYYAKISEMIKNFWEEEMEFDRL